MKIEFVDCTNRIGMLLQYDTSKIVTRYVILFFINECLVVSFLRTKGFICYISLYIIPYNCQLPVFLLLHSYAYARLYYTVCFIAYPFAFFFYMSSMHLEKNSPTYTLFW